MLEKTYDPHAIEAKFYKRWEDASVHMCLPGSQQPTFTIMMPPPNVTGSLHMGHALTYTLQDILVRYNRMLHKDVLWQPGTDHAGIATQMVVERQLEAQGLSRKALGRNAFLEKVWAWKEESGSTIVRQMRRLGVLPDWHRARFTMDKGLSDAVRKVFIQLYNEKLIYRDKRLVNWDVKLQTALSDLEVDMREEKGTLWYIAYQVTEDASRSIVVATSRPETMFGDVAVAVHPDDERYKALIGKHVYIPISGKKIPVIADEHADPEKGSGAVKITPAHDFNDFEVGKRHHLTPVNIFDKMGALNERAPVDYIGLDRFVAREKVLLELQRQHLLVKEEESMTMRPYGERSGVILEPRITDQWYVDAHTLAQPAIEAVRTGKTKFVPENWGNVYFEWLDNIQPWCISRQLWWGHRIPAWYGPDGFFFVAESEEEAKGMASHHYGIDLPLRQDEDVLDTWFSSALWPFATLGWPDATPELARYYPTDVLITGGDIIFFWVARMMMMGLHFMKKVPFKTVCLHALVRDEKGQKMSKTKGNVIDPLVLMDQYGADPLRFAMAALFSPGRDVKFGHAQVEHYRSFATKLWNASRFALMNQCRYDHEFYPFEVKHPLNQWLISTFLDLTARVTEALDTFQFNEAASALYQFTWGDFCDWYVECAKSILSDDTHPSQHETRLTTGWVLGRLYQLLHPIMPSITEELWASLCDDETLLAPSKWPHFNQHIQSELKAATPFIEGDFAWMMTLITQVRAIRAEASIAPGVILSLTYKGEGADLIRRLETLSPFILKLARLSAIQHVPTFGEQSLIFVVDGTSFAIPIDGALDVNAEKERLLKDIKKALDDAALVEKKLANADFVARAPQDVITENRDRLAKAQDRMVKLQEALDRLPQ